MTPEPSAAPRSTIVRRIGHSASVLGAPSSVVARGTVVDEEDPVSDEHLVLNLHAVADERVAGDLASGADRPPRPGSPRTLRSASWSPMRQPYRLVNDQTVTFSPNSTSAITRKGASFAG